MKEKVFDFIGKWIMIALGVIASLGAFVNMFDIPMFMPVVILMSMFFAGIFLAVSKADKKYKIIFHAAVFVVLAIVIVILRKQLATGIYSISNSIIDVYNNYFGGNISFFKIKKISSYHDIKKYNAIVAVITAGIYSFILVTATWYKMFASIHILLSLCFVLPGLVLGVIPNSFYISMLMIYYMACFMYQHSKVIYPARLMALVILSICIIGLIFLVCPPYAYDGENRYKSANKKLNDIAEKLSLDNFSKGKFDSIFQGNGKNKEETNGKMANGGINGGKLGGVDSVTYSGTVMLNVQMTPDDSKIYLKGFVGTEYRGKSWVTASDNMDAKINQLYDQYGAVTSDEKDAVKRNVFSTGYKNYVKEMYKKMTIAYENDPATYRYFPYYSDIVENGKLRFYYAIRPETKGITTEDVYEYNYAGIPEHEMYQKYSLLNEDINIYNYIKETNLEVPANLEDVFMTIPELEKDCYDETPQKLEECIEIVRKYLEENTEYSLKPGKLTYSDFVEDFLLYKKKGYCTAYASSAVLMLRYMGVPARYVEGYIIQPSDYQEQLMASTSISDFYQESIMSGLDTYDGYLEDSLFINVEVKDNSAHAWVEVYVPGLGFAPIEVTPGYMGSDGSSQNEETKKNEPDTSKEGESQTTSDSRQTTGKNENPSETTTEENGNTESGRIGGNAGGSDTGGNFDGNSHKIIILILAGVTVLIVISLIIYKLAEEKKKTNDYNTDDNRTNMMILIKIFEECLRKSKVEYSMNVNISTVEEEIAAKVDKTVQRIESKKNADRESNTQMAERLRELKNVREVLELIYRYKYGSDNVEFTDDEVDSVKRYVERYRDSLKVIKNS